jgi:polysaccharide pyruvyl transferase CsaB
MKLGLIGNYGATNVGDEAILASILKKHPQHEWTVFSANPAETAAHYGMETAPLFPFGVRSALKFGFKRAYRALKKCDAVVLGGGGLFQDDVKMACPLWAYQVLWVRSLKKPLYIYGAGVGPLKTKVGRSLTKKTFQYATAISVRDESSRALLMDLGIAPEKITLTADPAFLNAPQPHQELNTKNPVLLVSVRPWRNVPKVVQLLSETLKEIPNAKIKFVSMQGIKEGDSPVIAKLIKNLGGEAVAPKDFHELLSVMKTADFAIGMRYHFGIAAMLTGTPCLLLSYSPKVSSLYQGELTDYSLKVAGLEKEALKKALHQLMSHGPAISHVLLERAKTLHEKALENRSLTLLQ